MLSCIFMVSSSQLHQTGSQAIAHIKQSIFQYGKPGIGIIIDTISIAMGEQQDYWNLIMTFRRIELAMGCTIILFMIVKIIHRKLFVYNTMRLYLFMCICYFLGMVVVLLHLSAFTANQLDASLNVKDSQSEHYILNVLKKMKQWKSSTVLCGFEAFINLYFYCLGYLFAVLITYNIYCIINNTHRDFMRKIIRNKLIVAFAVFMLCVYLTPLILMFASKYSEDGYWFSYGPSGFNFKNKYLLLFCGACSNPGKRFTAYLILGLLYICPIILLVIHIYLACIVRNKTKGILEQGSFLNAKQNFILKSGKIGVVMLVIQLVNFAKEIFFDIDPASWWVIMAVNFLFDFYPIPLLIFFIKYTKSNMDNRAGQDTILSEHD